MKTCMRVVCKRAAIGYERLEGTKGILQPRSLPLLGHFYNSDGDTDYLLIVSASDWCFAEEPDVALFEAAREIPPEPAPTADPPLRRAREVYDQDSFAEDLDLAINYIRSVARDHHQQSQRQPHLPPGTSMREAIGRVCDVLALRTMAHYEGALESVLTEARKMLISKNAAYGNSALDPVRVFSSASLKEQLLVRLDDKVSRLARGSAAGEDVAGDMLGYLLLVAIAEKREREQEPTVGAQPIAAHWRTDKP